MSVDATRWAWMQRGLSASQRLLLLALADRANAADEVFPSARAVMFDTEQDRKTVLKAITDLLSRGLLVDTGRRVGNGVRVLRLVGVEHRERVGLGTDPKNGTGPKSNRSQKRDVTGPKNGTATGPKFGTRNLKGNLKGTGAAFASRSLDNSGGRAEGESVPESQSKHPAVVAERERKAKPPPRSRPAPLSVQLEHLQRALGALGGDDDGGTER